MVQCLVQSIDSRMKRSLFSILICLSSQSASAQTLEPKLYANAPVGVNVVLMGYGRTQGAIPENTALELEDPNLKINSAFLAYGRSFDIAGRNAKIDLLLVTSSLYGTAQVDGVPASRDVSGMGDTKVRFTYNLFGAPALSLQEFASYEQKTIVGVSIQTTIPTGQYDSSKLINISTNRWAIKPAIGISKRVGKYTFEFTGDAEFYTSNDNFFGGIKRKQDPIYSTQAHLLYSFRKGLWLAVGTTYYWGGEYSNDGVEANNELGNTRLGLTFAYPINKQHSIKVFGNSGINTRYGSDFDALSVAWQYNWAD